MAKPTPTRPAPSDDDVRIAEGDLPDTVGPPLKDPRSVSAIDNIGVDDAADLLDVELDDQLGDIEADGHSFAEDHRSDMLTDDEASERR